MSATEAVVLRFVLLQVLNVGSFATELEAARAWNAAAVHYRGFATLLNPVEPLLPEDGGVAVAAKLPQPPWGSLLLGQQHNQQLLQDSTADNGRDQARREQHESQEVQLKLASDEQMAQLLRVDGGGSGASGSGAAGADGLGRNSRKRRGSSQQPEAKRSSCRLNQH